MKIINEKTLGIWSKSHKLTCNMYITNYWYPLKQAHKRKKCILVYVSGSL